MSLADPEVEVQEQAVTLVRNLVYGEPDSVEQIFADGSMLFQAIEEQLTNPCADISLQVRPHAILPFLSEFFNHRVWSSLEIHEAYGIVAPAFYESKFEFNQVRVLEIW